MSTDNKTSTIAEEKKVLKVDILIAPVVKSSQGSFEPEEESPYACPPLGVIPEAIYAHGVGSNDTQLQLQPDVRRQRSSRWNSSENSISSSFTRRQSVGELSECSSELTEWGDKYDKNRAEEMKTEVISTLRDSLKLNKTFMATFLEQKTRNRNWLNSFKNLDPRHQIILYYEEVARQGGPLEDPLAPRPTYLLRGFMKAAAFTIWRPTGSDAIRKMIRGEATGKGLDIKGKSAKIGKLCGLVPYLQISINAHKKKILRPPRDARVRIYYKSPKLRDAACKVLNDSLLDIFSKSKEADAKMLVLSEHQDEREYYLECIHKSVEDPSITILNKDGYGLEVPERVFFDVYITTRNISPHGSKFETGRASEPAFQDMNAACVRKYKGYGPRAVIYQTCDTKALRPQSLVIAYEENGCVTPVASDFDCFTVGTRGVVYDSPLPDDQVDLLKNLVDRIESILESPSDENWTRRWLQILKNSYSTNKDSNSAVMPDYGYGDPKSYEIMKGAAARFSHNTNGAVRHGAESFNYAFPQEIDDHFLVISDELEGPLPWKYVNVEELQEFLCRKIDDGFCFPLNPKWILADKGWKRVYDKMMACESVGVQRSLNTWYPPQSCIRDQINNVFQRFPGGFEVLNSKAQKKEIKMEGMDAMNLSMNELRRYLIVRRVRMKIKAALMFRTYGGKVLRTSANMLLARYNKEEKRQMMFQILADMSQNLLQEAIAAKEESGETNQKASGASLKSNRKKYVNLLKGVMSSKKVKKSSHSKGIIEKNVSSLDMNDMNHPRGILDSNLNPDPTTCSLKGKKKKSWKKKLKSLSLRHNKEDMSQSALLREPAPAPAQHSGKMSLWSKVRKEINGKRKGDTE